MKFLVDYDSFEDAIKWVSKTVGERQSLAAMAGIHLTLVGDKLTLASTNGKSSSEVTIGVRGEEDGVTLIPGGTLRKVVTGLPKDKAIQLEATADNAVITAGSATFTLHIMAAEDYPVSPAQDLFDSNEPLVHMSAELFINMYNHVSRCVSLDMSRINIASIFLQFAHGRVTATTTDTYRLGIHTVKADCSITENILVDPKAIEQVCDAAKGMASPIAMMIVHSFILFDLGDKRIIATLREGEFLPYRNIIATENELVARFERKELLSIIKRMSILAEIARDKKPVRCEFDSGNLTITIESQNVGASRDQMPIEYTTDPITIGFNPSYLRDGLEIFDGDSLTFSMKDPIANARMTYDGELPEDVLESLYVIMPLRVA